MLRSVALLVPWLSMLPAAAQLGNEAAVDVLVEEILAGVSSDAQCRLRSLWTFTDSEANEHIVRVHGEGEGCAAAIAEATDRGRPFGIRFATLPRPDSAQPDEIRIRMRAPRLPDGAEAHMAPVSRAYAEFLRTTRPRDLVLIDDRITPASP